MVLYAPRLNSAMTAAISRKRGTGRELHFRNSPKEYQYFGQRARKNRHAIEITAKIGVTLLNYGGYVERKNKTEAYYGGKTRSGQRCPS